jgi:energy-coupling factor transporter ATP-binding protein EcfA2
MSETPPLVSSPGRLTAIEITNYRAFIGTFRLEFPNGENAIIYGENGSGKSSLYHSLRTFLEAPDLRTIDSTSKRSRPLTVNDNAHRFTTGRPALKLEFDGIAYEWTELTNDTKKDIVRLINQGKGFLDYKALLEVHYVREGEAVTRWLQNGDQVIVATGRPSHTAPTCLQWLSRNGFSGTGLLFVDKYSRPLQTDPLTVVALDCIPGMGFDVLIEDSPDVATYLAQRGCEVLLVRRPWNQHITVADGHSAIFVADAWEQVCARVEELRR